MSIDVRTLEELPDQGSSPVGLKPPVCGPKTKCQLTIGPIDPAPFA